jgi:hypothetical protein
MRYFTTVLSCLLSLFGCQDKVTSTSITRISEQGIDQLFSRTSVRAESASFECVNSASGRCYYQVFKETCDGQQHCQRGMLQAFDVRAGHTHKREGLPTGFKTCVSNSTAIPCQ